MWMLFVALAVVSLITELIRYARGDYANMAATL